MESLEVGIFTAAGTALATAISVLWKRVVDGQKEQQVATAEAKAVLTEQVEKAHEKLEDCEKRHEEARVEYIDVVTQLTEVKTKVEVMNSQSPHIIDLVQGVHKLIDAKLDGGQR